MTQPTDMPQWPDDDLRVPVSRFNSSSETTRADAYAAQCEYERARAEAAIERLRIAVEALQEMNVNADLEDLDYNHRQCVELSREALTLIGPVPLA